MVAEAGPLAVLHRLEEARVRPVKLTVETHNDTPSSGNTFAVDPCCTAKLPGADDAHQHLHCVAAQAAGYKMEEVAPLEAEKQDW